MANKYEKSLDQMVPIPNKNKFMLNLSGTNGS